jgi:hypothetical protein
MYLFWLLVFEVASKFTVNLCRPGYINMQFGQVIAHLMGEIDEYGAKLNQSSVRMY